LRTGSPSRAIAGFNASGDSARPARARVAVGGAAVAPAVRSGSERTDKLPQPTYLEAVAVCDTATGTRSVEAVGPNGSMVPLQEAILGVGAAVSNARDSSSASGAPTTCAGRNGQRDDITVVSPTGTDPAQPGEVRLWRIKTDSIRRSCPRKSPHQNHRRPRGASNVPQWRHRLHVGALSVAIGAVIIRLRIDLDANLAAGRETTRHLTFG